MIAVTVMCEKGGLQIDCGTRQCDPLDALYRLMKFELGFGGRVTALDDDGLIVETQVLDNHDTTIFAGPADEMAPLVELAQLYSAVGETDLVEETVLRSLPEDGLSALNVKLSAGILFGGARLKAATLCVLGVTGEADAKLGMAARIEDVIAAAQLSRDGVCSFTEALAAAA